MTVTLNPKMDVRTIRIKIDGSIQNYELTYLLETMEELYQLAFALMTFHKVKELYLNEPAISLDYSGITQRLKFSSINYPNLTTVFDIISKVKNDRLKFYDKSDLYAFNFSQRDYIFEVARINYNSPGDIDLFGIGKVLNFIKDFVTGIINFKHIQKEKNLKNQLLEQEVIKSKIENAKRVIELGKELKLDNITVSEIENFVGERQDRLMNLIENGKLKEVKLIDKN